VKDCKNYQAVVIGTSAGGLKALKVILENLPDSFYLPIIIVQHLNPQSDGFLAQYLNQHSGLNVKEAESGEPIIQKHVYIAPANYHLLVEKNRTLSLTVSEKVNYARPSIDLLFESAAEVFLHCLIGILLTGANDDGSRGIAKINHFGGLTIAQNPESAEVNMMPVSAIKTGKVDIVLHLEEIPAMLASLCKS